MQQHVRIGLISDSPLQQHLLQTVIADEGYDIAVNTSPDRLNKAILHSDTISIWVVDLLMEEEHSDFLDDLLEHTDTPIFFGEGISPDRNSIHFDKWCRRLIQKLRDISPPTQESRNAPITTIDDIALEQIPDSVTPIQASFKYANPTQIDQVWVVAASLGGPEAVKAFFDSLPRELPIAFLYAQHIDEGCLEALVQSIGRHTQLDMQLAESGVQLENGKVLVVPVAHEIDFHANNSVELMPEAWSGPYGPCIDHLLENVVRRYGARANAIIFSGMGSDGSIGATLVKEAGGFVWSQDHASATQPSMPDSANETGCVSFRGTPGELARHLVNKMLVEQKSEQATIG